MLQHALHRCPHCSCTRRIATCLIVARAMLPPLQPHMSHHCMPCHCTGHVAPLAATHVALLCTLSLHEPCRPPHGHTCHVAVRLIVAWAMSPPLQLHTSHRRTPCCCIGHVTPLAAAHTMLLCTWQLHRPHRHPSHSCTHCCVPCSCTPRHTPHSCTGHVTMHLVAARHIAAPLAVLAPRPTGYCL